jgi:hypothetical protein
MRRAIVVAALLLGGAGGAQAQDTVPNFVGTWWGEFEVAIMGRTAGTEPQIEKVTITYELTGQNDRLLWGTVSSDHTNGTRPIVLAFSFNNGTLIGSDTAGFHRFTVISPTRMESCFTDNGSGSLVATCGILDREHRQ